MNDMSELHRTITEALDQSGLQYGQPEDREDLYFLEREGVLLAVGARGMNGVPAMVQIQAIVLDNVECTAELTADLLKRNNEMVFTSWAIHYQSDETVKVSLGYELDVAQLDVRLVEKMINWVLNKATAEVDALQETYGGKRPVVIEEPVVEEPPNMPEGPLTWTGRYPGYEPARAMAIFLSASGEPDKPYRPSYEERHDYWVSVFNEGGYGLVLGCFVETDGTTVIAVTALCDPEYSKLASKLLWNERFALQQSAHSTDISKISKAVASGALRQLRPSEIGITPSSAKEEPALAEAADYGLRYDGLYYAENSPCGSYLRFYADGTVLQASTSGRPEQIARWFSKTHTEVPRGTYTVRGGSIGFSTVSSEGTVAYEGQVSGGAIDLNTHSHINGHKAQETYSFVQVALQ